MRRYVVLFVAVMGMFLGGILPGMRTGAMAQDQVQMTVTMFNNISSQGQTFGISFDLSGDALKDVNRVLIDGPRGRRIWLNNTLNLNEVHLASMNLSQEEFNRLFPEGDYKISLTPPTFGKLKVHMTHNFPTAPAVLNPLQGSTNVPTDPVISWAPITGIVDLVLQLKDDSGFALRVDLPINATSYAVPAGLLKPNTAYELSLEAKSTDFSGNGLITTTFISFTTAGS